MLGFIAGLIAGIGIFIGGWAFISRVRLFGAVEVVLAVAAFVLSLAHTQALPWYLIAMYVAVVILAVVNLIKIRTSSKHKKHSK